MDIVGDEPNSDAPPPPPAAPNPLTTAMDVASQSAPLPLSTIPLAPTAAANAPSTPLETNATAMTATSNAPVTPSAHSSGMAVAVTPPGAKNRLSYLIEMMSQREKFYRSAPYMKCTTVMNGNACLCNGWKNATRPLNAPLQSPKEEDCIACRHSLVAHGNLTNLKSDDLDRIVAVVIQIEHHTQEGQKNPDPAKKKRHQDIAANLKRAMQHPLFLERLHRTSSPAVRAQGDNTTDSSVVPPFDRPVVVVIVKNLLQEVAIKRTDLNKNALNTIAQKFIVELTNYSWPPLPAPPTTSVAAAGTSVSSASSSSSSSSSSTDLVITTSAAGNEIPLAGVVPGGDIAVYASNYNRWLICCKQNSFKSTQIFGKWLLRAFFKEVRDIVFRPGVFPFEMQTEVDVFFQELEKV